MTIHTGMMLFNDLFQLRTLINDKRLSVGERISIILLTRFPEVSASVLISDCAG